MKQRQNDDGPPDPIESPYIYGLYKHLVNVLGWDVKVVIPSSQKSWIGFLNVFLADGQGETSSESRPLRDDEVGEWILLNGTPASCTNIALHNLYPGQIDLVISGPNLGRNTSSAFALSSGTVGAAMSGALSHTRAIALSYGTVVHPVQKEYYNPAHVVSLKIIKHLVENWGVDEGGLRVSGEVDLYNINVPMVPGLLSNEGLKVYWTSIWRNSYGRLFKPVVRDVNPAGPDAPVPSTSPTLAFKWAPAIEGLVNPAKASLPTYTDAWALNRGQISVTALRASFAEADMAFDTTAEDGGRLWEVNLKL
ncbi:sure-like protein [Fistulina hepatica ATCC 64428]|uniref:Sure-like protein n=1 Tax=Fistulina hepatica ATCC 64428 TaxID=1128425 RepID=A0A0D7AMG7_9AGAR|nr:sure-like protein [Fistulina hepatica ATCC 64428]